jgi:hypothetical protein
VRKIDGFKQHTLARACLHVDIGTCLNRLQQTSVPLVTHDVIYNNQIIYPMRHQLNHQGTDLMYRTFTSYVAAQGHVTFISTSPQSNLH